MASAATAPSPTQGHDESPEEMSLLDEIIDEVVARVESKKMAERPSSWGSELSPDFQLGQIWQKVTDEAFKSLKTHKDWDVQDAAAMKAFGQENCTWIK